jgi:hypothetical protein
MTTNHEHLREVAEAAKRRVDSQRWSGEYPDEFRVFIREVTPDVVIALLDELATLRKENKRLSVIINTPQSDDFLRAVSTEAEHQRQRWGSDHDQGKAPADWFWLVGYLAGKALHKHADGDIGKAEHHIITTAAACANWHRAMFGKTNMRPGIDAAHAAIGDSHE